MMVAPPPMPRIGLRRGANRSSIEPCAASLIFARTKIVHWTSEVVTPVFVEDAERVHERRLLHGAARGLEEEGAGEYHSCDLRSRNGDVDAVHREEERDVAGQFLAARLSVVKTFGADRGVD